MVLILQGRPGPAAGIAAPEFFQALIDVRQAVRQVGASGSGGSLCRLLDRCEGAAQHAQVDAAGLLPVHAAREAEARARTREGGS